MFLFYSNPLIQFIVEDKGLNANIGAVNCCLSGSTLSSVQLTAGREAFYSFISAKVVRKVPKVPIDLCTDATDHKHGGSL